MTRTSFAFLLFASLLISLALPINSAIAKKGVSGFPVPRYVSLRSDKVNLRQGPGKDYAIKWVFKRINLPIEVIAEYEHWRKVRDSQGTEGWVFHRMLTGRRTALITPSKTKQDVTFLYSAASNKSQPTAKVESGVLASVSECNGQWCLIEALRISGWIKQSLLWGVYPGEKVK